MLSYTAQRPQTSRADSTFAWLQLARSPRVGPTTFHTLLQRYGSAEAALEALPQRAARSGQKQYRPADPALIHKEIELADKAGATLIRWGTEGYPPLLERISDAPPIVWAIGNTDILKRDAIAIVGARNASALGQRMAAELATGLGAAALMTASGLARGIDTAVHRASLAQGTIAVLAGGVDQIYPQQNTQLAREIYQNGVLLSEAPMGLQPIARHFPKRNRIIAGLSRATVLVEAAERSGSLITAQVALDQGRDVMAVPGNPFDARTAGCNRLIRDGATLIRSAEDILTALEISHIQPSQAEPLDPTPQITADPPDELRQMLGNLISSTPVAEDILIRHLGVPAPIILEALMELDLAGHIERHPGGMVSRRMTR